MSVTSSVPRWEEYTSFGVQYITPMRKSLRKVITCVGPLLIINLGISHVLLNGSTSTGPQKWPGTCGSAWCPTNQITLGRGICQRRERTSILAGSSESLYRSTEGSFYLRTESVSQGLSDKASELRDTWVYRIRCLMCLYPVSFYHALFFPKH